MRKLVFKKNEIVKLICVDDENVVLEVNKIWWKDKKLIRRRKTHYQ